MGVARLRTVLLFAALTALPAEARWLADCSRAAPPAAPLQGSVQGRAFRPNRTELLLRAAPRGVQRSTYVLRFAQISGPYPDIEATITVITPLGQGLAGKSFLVDARGPMKMPGAIREGSIRYPPVQGVTFRWREKGKSASQTDTPRKYTLRLQFGKSAAGRVPGTLYFCVQDPARTWVAGKFSAVPRQLK